MHSSKGIFHKIQKINQTHQKFTKYISLPRKFMKCVKKPVDSNWLKKKIQCQPIHFVSHESDPFMVAKKQMKQWRSVVSVMRATSKSGWLICSILDNAAMLCLMYMCLILHAITSLQHRFSAIYYVSMVITNCNFLCSLM